MGALNSSVRKISRPDWIAPSSTRKRVAGIAFGGTSNSSSSNGTTVATYRNRLSSLIINKCFTGKLASFQWRRKCRQISREDQRAFCALISHWTSTELAAFLTEMESAWAVRELMLMAEEARPSTSLLATDLFNALQNEIVTDCFVIHKGIRYAAHSVILRARCRYFADVWDSMIVAQSGTKTLREIPFIDSSISLELFKAMLYYIYTGEYDKSLRDFELETLNSILQRYGCGSSLPGDLANFDHSKMDCTLIFTTGGSNILKTGVRDGNRIEDRDFRVKCSAAVLSARSTYLRSLIEKRIACSEKLEIVINEHLFPRIYAHIILDAIYTDRLDLNKIPEGCQVSASSLSEVQAIASGQRQLAPLRHAIDIFHIAQFLSLPQLIHACEDAIVAQISMETVASLWNWSSESGGSAYVRRHCTAFLRSEFSRLCSSHILFELDEDLLKECLLSDYVQCAEVEILEAVIRWGEHELVRRMEEREPNLIANTTHSISRKGIRRSELNDEELRGILANLLPLVRIDYILPPFHQSLNAAYKRGLLDRSPHMMDLLGQQYPDSRSPDVNPDAHWFDHSVPRRHAAGPRLLLPYIVETREQLRRLCGSGGNVRSSCTQQQKDSSVDSLQLVVINLSPETISEGTKLKIEKRVNELADDDLMKKACFCGCPHHIQFAINQIRLRTLREMNINEDCVEVLCSCSASRRDNIPPYYCSQPSLAVARATVNIDISLSSTTLSDYDNEDGSGHLPDVLRNEATL